MNHEEIWQQFLIIAREEVGSRVVETWFKAITIDEWDAATQKVFLRVPNSFVKDWVEKHYIPLIKTHLGRLFHTHDLKVICADTKIEKEAASSPATMVIPARVASEGRHYPLKKKRPLAHLNDNYTFESFVVGPSNSLAYAAAYAVTEKPGTLYNPLFMYGGSGLGKTHLLHAIGNEIARKNRTVEVLYQPADRFVNEFINAIRFDKIPQFQAKYQRIDVLLIDDIQFISNKEQTQEAFFHIFNFLYEAHKQIVFSSDAYPHTMKGVAERLRSRLSWGLVTDLHLPSLETKVAIIKKKAAAGNHVLSDDVAHLIASQVVSNIRELEGALIRVVAFAALTNQQITISLAQKVLSHAGVSSGSKTIGFDNVIEGVARFYSYTLTDLRSKNRNKELVLVRQIAMFLMKKLTDKSLRDIGNFLGGRDHSTVMHAIQKVEDACLHHSDLNQKLQRLEQEIVQRTS